MRVTMENSNWVTNYDDASLNKFLIQVKSYKLRDFVFNHYVALHHYRLHPIKKDYWRLEFWCPNGPGQDNSLHYVDHSAPEETAIAAYLHFCKHKMKG
jgi:hypothetical protein